MRSYVLLCAIIFLNILHCFCNEKYTTAFDNVNVEEILSSERLLNNYFKCMMDRGSCPPDAAELKRNLPDALQTDCSKCSEKQKEVSKQIVKFLIEKKPNMWKELQEKYDPEQVYIKKFAQHLDIKV
uniref:Chemosensory protein 6 n=1 Tax=Dastarcus helophoroides TaxID=1169899 RepID=A0A1I9HZR4_9CUCU|nr:chemosensory protein 6 [Dastarcus helophoroides]